MNVFNLLLLTKQFDLVVSGVYIIVIALKVDGAFLRSDEFNLLQVFFCGLQNFLWVYSQTFK